MERFNQALSGFTLGMCIVLLVWSLQLQKKVNLLQYDLGHCNEQDHGSNCRFREALGYGKHE